MWFQHLGREIGIGHNSYLLDLEGTRVLLDTGMHPKRVGHAATPDFSPIAEDPADAIIVTHSHLDHVGCLPLAQRASPEAAVYVSPAAAQLGEAMLHNSVNVMTSQRDEFDIAEYPLFTHGEIDRIAPEWVYTTPGAPFSLPDSCPTPVTCEFFDAGHILGAMAARLTVGDTSILYTGDIHFEDQTLTPGADLPQDGVDILILESTRGHAPRDPTYTRAREIDRLCAAMNETIDRGGAVLLPVFAMGKTQELLTIIHDLKGEGKLPDIPVTMAGLGVKMTIIYDRFSTRAPRVRPGFKVLREVALTGPDQSRGRRRAKAAPPSYEPRHLYAVSSGMMSEHTHSNRLARQVLPDPRNSVLFVGYTDPDTPGGKVNASQPGDMITLDPNHPPVQRNCSVQRFDFSGHADRDSLLAYACKLAPRQIFLVHGDEEAMAWFKSELAARLPDTEVLVPEPGGRYDLRR